jgi:hypothetical protein
MRRLVASGTCSRVPLAGPESSRQTLKKIFNTLWKNGIAPASVVIFLTLRASSGGSRPGPPASMDVAMVQQLVRKSHTASPGEIGGRRAAGAETGSALERIFL